uniref:HSF-type DNA-binding domain-containing protein n=1 Tax=Nelumbo nucifera TaxID=4432 RepID=A0A822Y8E6_NELNU|nr:TPA_asm: hypothetical protein HUJ06_009175 [Nelumbo nucifera]
MMPLQPMEGLHDAGPPLFLKKTYDMVKDLATNSIVFWSKACNSFIFWDSHKFSTNLLPKYFAENTRSVMSLGIPPPYNRVYDSERKEATGGGLTKAANSRERGGREWTEPNRKKKGREDEGEGGGG